jgi:hypothetical protein
MDYRVTVRFTRMDTDDDPIVRTYDVASADLCSAAFEAGRMERRPAEPRTVAEVISIRGAYESYEGRRMDPRVREALNGTIPAT